jgi:TolB-like protein
MEYVEGKSLRAVINEYRLSFDKIIDLMNQICEGLLQAHQAEIVHRDLKPENIIIGRDGRVRILDFGLAKLKGVSKITKETSTFGTIHYMSPEGIQGQEVDQRSDIWSLGVVLYELLTGEVPFKGDYEQAVTYAILNEDPRLIIHFRRDVPINLQQIVLKMLKKDCNDRFQNMKELLQGFRDILIDFQGKEDGKKGKNIAVLPFENISPEKENDYFSDGLTEELIVNLSRLKDMKIVSRTTSMQYKGTKKNIKTIGIELGTRYIIEGSVRKHQDNLRISVQLIDVESDTQLWSETYKGKLADVFDIQEHVSKQIVEALLLKLTVNEKVVLSKRATLNAEAFDLNLRGRDFLNQLSKNKVKIAIQLFEKATEIDPRYAAAYAGLGHSYALFYQLFERKPDLLDKSIELSLKALMYDAGLSEAYASLSLAYYNKDSLDEALEASQKAIELDPDNFIAYWMLGRIYRCMDRDRESVDLFKKVTILNPEFLTAYMDLRMVYEKLGEKKITDEILQNILTISPKYLLKYPDDARAHILYAIHLAIGGKINEAKTEAAKALELDPTDPLMQYNAACFYSRIGEKYLALESLKKSVVSGYEYYEWIKRDPDLNGIRNEPEYIKLMEGK